MHKKKRLAYILKKMEEERVRLFKAQKSMIKEPGFHNEFDKPYGHWWEQLERTREELYVCIRELEDLL